MSIPIDLPPSDSCQKETPGKNHGRLRVILGTELRAALGGARGQIIDVGLFPPPPPAA